MYPRDSSASGVRRSAVLLDLQTNARDRPGCTAGTKSRVLGKGIPEAACNERMNISRRNVAEVSFLCDEAVDRSETESPDNHRNRISSSACFGREGKLRNLSCSSRIDNHIVLR